MQRPVPKKDTAIPPTSEYFFLLYYIMAIDYGNKVSWFFCFMKARYLPSICNDVDSSGNSGYNYNHLA